MSIFDFISKSILPLVYYDKHKKLNIAGTSVLAEHKGNHFLLTAAHVLTHLSSSNYKICLALPTKIIELPYPLFLSHAPNNDKNIKSDYLDIAFFPLFPIPKLLEGFNTISLKEYNEQIDYVNDLYLIFGFPETKFKHFPGKIEYKIGYIEYTTILVTDPSEYIRLKISPISHLLVKYEPNDTVNSKGVKINPPSPYGVSGGPLFRLLFDKNGRLIKIIIEGLLTDWVDKKIVVATKKSNVREFIDSCMISWVKIGSRIPD